MGEVATLERRRQLVELSADLQRAALARRIASVEQHPSRAVLGFVAGLAARPGIRRMALAAAVMVFRAWRRRGSIRRR